MISGKKVNWSILIACVLHEMRAKYWRLIDAKHKTWVQLHNLPIKSFNMDMIDYGTDATNSSTCPTNRIHK